MKYLFRGTMHRLFVIVVAVAAGMGAYWYSQEHHHKLWIMALIAAGVSLVLDLTFRPLFYLYRHRPHLADHPTEAVRERV
jgi:hypothetical protein